MKRFEKFRIRSLFLRRKWSVNRLETTLRLTLR